MDQYIEKAISYSEYLTLIDSLLAEGKTTGPNSTDDLVQFTKLNRARMERLDKTVVIEPETEFTLAANEKEMTWWVITEGWCGDAAQNVPVIEAMAARTDKISTRYILRDENLELIDQFLTDGARAIPKLIAVDAKTREVLGTWGARPREAHKLFKRLQEEGSPKPEVIEALQRWYNADKGRSIQNEFMALLNQWNESKAAFAVK